MRDTTKANIFAITGTKLIPSIHDKEICANYTLYRFSLGREEGCWLAFMTLVESEHIEINGFNCLLWVYYHHPIFKDVDNISDILIHHMVWEHALHQRYYRRWLQPIRNRLTDTLLKMQKNVGMHTNFLGFVETSLDQPFTVPTHSKGNVLYLVIYFTKITTPQVKPSC